MKIRIISDLHINLNKNHNLNLWNRDDILTIIAGDISNDIKITNKFLEKNFKRVIFIEGNHLVYAAKNKPIQQLYKEYKIKFPKKKEISFLQDDYKEIDGIIFIGCTLWTNYTYGDLPLLKKIENATAYMDEMFPHATYLEKNKPVQLRPTHCIKMFEKSLKYIEKICTKFNDKKIVLITHHCVSGKAILPKYKTYINNPAITTDIEDFIKKFPNIKLIIHGHTHGKCDYFIHGIPVICNPLGVIDKGEDEGFNKDLFVDI